MNIFKELFSNYWLMSVLGAWFFAQILKVFTGVFRQREFTIRAMIFGSGGMPSSHTASVAALATSTAIRCGVSTWQFAISAILCVIVMTDATGVRRETGKHSEALNRLLQAYRDDENPLDLFRELIGHSPLQVFCGFLTGVTVAILFSFIPGF